jgi:hypothetical protein
MTSGPISFNQPRGILTIALAVFAATAPSRLIGQQWSTGSNGAIYYSGGDVGIGTSVPLGMVHVNGLGAAASSQWNIYTSARFGDGGQNSHTAVLFDTGATGTAGLRGFWISKWSQAFNIARFDSAGVAAPLTDLSIAANGNVGIGFTTPRALLDVSGPIAITNSANVGGVSFSTTFWPASGGGGLLAWNKSNGQGEVSLVSLSGGGADGGFSFYDRDSPLMRITKAGNVGIGTATPAHVLHVQGTIGAEEVIVSSTGADYIFAPDYHLKPLNEVSAYIRLNHHLPEIPSAAEVKAKGVSLGEMQTKLLAKIEELTLHLIEVDERNKALEEQNRALAEHDRELRAIVNGLQSFMKNGPGEREHQ